MRDRKWERAEGREREEREERKRKQREEKEIDTDEQKKSMQIIINKKWFPVCSKLTEELLWYMSQIMLMMVMGVLYPSTQYIAPCCIWRCIATNRPWWSQSSVKSAYNGHMSTGTKPWSSRRRLPVPACTIYLGKWQHQDALWDSDKLVEGGWYCPAGRLCVRPIMRTFWRHLKDHQHFRQVVIVFWLIVCRERERER